jgi:hypothetical protein
MAMAYYARVSESMGGRAVRAIVLIAAFLATAATSKVSPYYPQSDASRMGSVYVHNATGATMRVSVALMAPDMYPECDATMQNDPEWIQPGQFQTLEWITRPAENVPLRSPYIDETQRPCHVGYVAAGDKRWSVRWWHDRPTVHSIPAFAHRGEGLTAGALRLHGSGEQMVLVAPPDVLVAPVVVPQRNDLTIAVSPEPRVPEWNNAITSIALGDLEDPIGGSEWTISLAANVRGMLGQRFGYAYGADFDFGSTNTGGFLYDFSMYPFGVAVEGGGARVGLVVGGGLSGITGDRIGLAWQIPVETFLTITAGKTIALSAWGRSQWVFREDPRQSGSDNALFGDELRAGLSLEILLADDKKEPSLRRGLSISLMYGELMGTKTIGVGIGSAFLQRLR